MTLDGETASRIAREVVGGGKATRVYPHSTDVALVRAGWDARDAEVEELLAQLAKVRERVERRHCADDPLCGHDDQVWADHFSEVVADVLAILDESPTERETPADEWEYGLADDGATEPYSDISTDRDWILDGVHPLDEGTKLLRRRPAGPWMEMVPDDRA